LTTTILLIRHGQTDYNLARRWQGHLDIPLNDRGRRQAHLLAIRLSKVPIRAVFTSDLARARETAEIVARLHNLDPIANAALRERYAGQFQGLTFEELTNNHAETWRRVRLENATPPGGESLFQVAQRAVPAFQAIIEGYKDQCVAIVSHGGTLNLLIASILGLPLGQPARISLRGNTGLSIIEVDESGSRLITLNDTNHLGSEDEPGLGKHLISPAETG